MRSVFISSIVLCAAAAPTGAQQRPDLFRCEGCDAIHEHSHENLTPSTVIPPRGEPGTTLILSGTVYQSDGRTPATGVVVYGYHTNAEGVYPTRGNEAGWARRHGYLRGWVKTGADGVYRFETIRPAPYPGRRDPAHIHLIVKEPERREYWIDEVVFDDDPLVDAAYRARVRHRGGNGVVHPTRRADGVWLVRRDITLEP